MQKTYQYPEYAYRQSDEQRLGQPQDHAVVVIGAGPVGLTMGLDLAERGTPVVVLDDNNSVSIGSRAVCYAKRTLEVWDRLGVAAPLVARGVSWKVGKVFHRDDLAYRFDLLPEPQHKLPAMINLQQYHLEERLVEACDAHPRVDLRWKHKLLALEHDDAGVRLTVETPDGVFQMHTRYLIACDGASSDVRRMMGLEFQGQAFQDRFLIADVVIQPKAGAPDPGALAQSRGATLQRLDAEPERWFWFDPPFHPGQSVLLHKQADQVWRIDFQLGWQADPVEEKRPERVIPRIRAMLGEDVAFELEWVSVYQFACRRMDHFRHGRVLFAGDSAHQVSPFGARGANTGVQDVDNLAWKLAAVLRGEAPDALLDSYDAERVQAADDNLGHSTRATDFITPKSATSRLLRDAVLELARDCAFARPLVNSGRLSTPTPYVGSALNSAEEDLFAAPTAAPGWGAPDAPLRHAGGAGWLVDLLGRGFVLLHFGPASEALRRALQDLTPAVQLLQVGPTPDDRPGGSAWLDDCEGLIAQRYGAAAGTAYLVRPDRVVAARWREAEPARVRAALDRALARA